MAKSPLKAYDAARWVACTGSVLMTTLLPPLPKNESHVEAAEQGKAFHAKSQMLLNTYVTGERLEPGLTTQVGQLTENGVLFDDEMYEAVMTYTGYVFSYANQHDLLNKIEVEKRIDLSCIYEGMYGYCDARIINRTDREIVLFDAKYGHSVIDAFENWQLICYAMGSVYELGLNGLDEQYWTVRLRVSQPRVPHIDGVNREWVIKVSDLRAYFNTLIAAATDALEGDGTCKSGNQCNKCPVRYGCDTFTRATRNAMDYIGNGALQLSGSDLAVEYRQIERAFELIKARRSAIEEQCIAEIRGGANLPGIAVAPRVGRERWRKDVAQQEVIDMGDLMGVDLRKPRELDTPAQCRKKGVDESVISTYSEKPSNGFKLVKDDGTRARQVFSK